MKKSLSLLAGILLMAQAAYAANALPTVKTFTVPTSAVSPIPVSSFIATDTDGTVTGYMITESSSKPSASASGWSVSPLTSYTTTKTGSVTLYAWAKDNAAGVSAAKSATTTIVSGHTHNQSDVVGLAASLAAKADAKALADGLAAKADVIHNHDALYQKKYGNVAVVAQTGGDYSDPYTAMANVSTWCNNGSPCLLKIMPGVYDIGTNIIPMASNVDIEGAGVGTTKIVGGFSYYIVGNTEIRAISIEGAISMQYIGDTSFKNVRIAPPADQGTAIWSNFTRGVVTIADSEIVASSEGINEWHYEYMPSLNIINSKITAGFAAVTRGGITSVTGSELTASVALLGNNAIVKNSVIKGGLNSGSFTMVNTQFLGGVSAGAAKCLNVYDADYNLITCQ
ncbi:MAG TPA: hypothetical protein HPP97_14140 [Desulfuromonadales bacterium]|nr:hypothetical protein [Desulfuromonadales bacterium]